MFDDPRKNLKRIEEELWAAEYEEEPQEETAFPGDVFSFRDSDWLQDTRAELPEEEEPAIRNFANGYGRRRGNDAEDFHRTVYADEEMDENSAVFVEKRKKQKKEKKKKRSSGCLVFLILLELIGLAGIGWWWYRWLS